MAYCLYVWCIRCIWCIHHLIYCIFPSYIKKNIGNRDTSRVKTSTGTGANTVKTGPQAASKDDAPPPSDYMEDDAANDNDDAYSVQIDGGVRTDDDKKHDLEMGACTGDGHSLQANNSTASHKSSGSHVNNYNSNNNDDALRRTSLQANNSAGSSNSKSNNSNSNTTTNNNISSMDGQVL